MSIIEDRYYDIDLKFKCNCGEVNVAAIPKEKRYAKEGFHCHKCNKKYYTLWINDNMGYYRISYVPCVVTKKTLEDVITFESVPFSSYIDPSISEEVLYEHFPCCKEAKEYRSRKAFNKARAHLRKLTRTQRKELLEAMKGE